jgi:hypothetical protein
MEGVTVSMVLRTIWDIIIEDQDPEETIEGLENCLRDFIASHSTAEDCHELVSQLRSPHKPWEILVQSFYHRLREVNGYVEWLPGNEPRLNDDQLKQALFDAMPFTWRERFAKAGHSSSAMTLAEVLIYFRQQESLAIRKQMENEKTQRNSKRFAARRDTKSNIIQKESHDSRTSTKSFSKKPSFTKKRKIIDTDPCPIHDGTHTWGECRANHYSEHNQKRFRSDKDKKENETKKSAKSSSNFAVHSSDKRYNSDNQDEKMDGSSTDGSFLNEDENMNSGNSFTVCTANMNHSSFALTNIFMSHFDTQTNLEDSLLMTQHFMQYMLENYILGNDESKIDEDNYINKDVNASLLLHPIGLVLTNKIQNIKSDRPLKTLFDPGSDKTFINWRVLPQGVNGKTVEPLPINTLNGIDTTNQKVVLEELTLPELSATQKIDKKVSAYIFNQPSSPYDPIFGLDLLVPLGIDILCLTQTISWIGESVSWKPKSYFNDTILKDSVEYEMHCFYINSTDDFDTWIESHSALRCLTSDEQTEMNVEREPSVAARRSPVQVIGRHTFLFDNRNWSYRVKIDHRCLAKLN